MSETVKRYWPDVLGNMEQEADGGYVAYDDYAALAQQLADVAYLEAWVRRERWRYVMYLEDSEVAVSESGDAPEAMRFWACASGLTVRSADSLPALGALLRQREGGR